MIDMHEDLGAALFKTWTDEQRRDEIGKLVEGYRRGVPIGILCKMAETIAGDKATARLYLSEFMTPSERRQAVDKETGAVKQIASEYLL